jgi:hypothetical protein
MWFSFSLWSLFNSLLETYELSFDLWNFGNFSLWCGQTFDTVEETKPTRPILWPSSRSLDDTLENKLTDETGIPSAGVSNTNAACYSGFPQTRDETLPGAGEAGSEPGPTTRR